MLALLPLVASTAANAQKQGGTLRIFHRDSPASMSIHEEGTISVVAPRMPIFNNLVLFNQHEKQNRLDDIVPDLADSWSWSEDGKDLTFKLHQGVKWHDGKPFTAADVKCTWDLLQGKATEKFRLNPRKSWYRNLDEVTTNGDDEVAFHLKRPQPYLPVLLASGVSPVYPCHVPPAQMRQHPIGTGPFKFAEFKPNESIKVVKNPEYWKPGLPYLDAIEYTVIKNTSTWVLALGAMQFDRTPVGIISIPIMKEIQRQTSEIKCETVPWNISRHMIVNRDKPPFDNPELRRAMTLGIDRDAFSTIINGGIKHIGATMMPPPNGVWGMPEEMLKTLPGYGPDFQKNLAEAREMMKKLGYGPDKKLELKVSTRNVATFRDPAVILIDQLKTIYIDGELELAESAVWFPKLAKRDYTIALGLGASGVDDPDQQFYQNYACGSELNVTGYCNKEIEALFDRQSMETDQQKRRELVWDIDQRLQRDDARPIIFYNNAATCWQPSVKGLTIMVNSIYNGWRMEDIWLE